MPILVKITNEVIKAHYIKKLAGILHVSEEAIIREMERVERKEEITGFRVKKSEKPHFVEASRGEKSRRERLEELILAMVLQQKKQIRKWLGKVEIGQIKSNPVKKIFKALEKFIKGLSSAKSFKINDFVKKLAKELIDTLDRAYLEDLRIDLTDQNKFTQEFNRAKKELDKLFFKEELAVLVERMKKIEKKGEEKNLENLKKEFSEVSKKLRDIV